jgi:uncharacterized protein
MVLEYSWAFVTGFLGSTHCLGMCGPLVAAYSLHLVPAGTTGRSSPLALSREGLAHHAAFHAGRIVTYGFMGAAVAGFVGLGSFNKWLLLLRSSGMITFVGGLFMILFGLALLRIFPLPFTDVSASKRVSPFLGRFTRTFLNARGFTPKFLLGLGTGFLPCMLSWAMVVRAATAENMVQGFTFMVLFGLGTAPLLLFAGSFASILTQRMRLASERIAAVSVMAMGAILLFKVVMRLV